LWILLVHEMQSWYFNITVHMCHFTDNKHHVLAICYDKNVIKYFSYWCVHFNRLPNSVHNILLHKHFHIDNHCRKVSSPDLHLGNTRFKPSFPTEFSVLFLIPSRKISIYYLKIDYNHIHILSDSLFMIHPTIHAT